MTEHVMGCTRVIANDEGDWCPFGSKTRRYCKMQHRRDRKVIYYGWEGGNVECSEYVPILPKSLYTKKMLEGKDLNDLYSPGNPEVFRQFNVALASEIMKRAEPGDVILNFVGESQREVFDLMQHVKCPMIEASVGYDGESFAKYRVYESHAKRSRMRGSFDRYHEVYKNFGGYEMIPPGEPEKRIMMSHRPDIMIPNEESRFVYDTVIEGFLDPDQFEIADNHEDYLMFIGRIVPSKGVDNAIRIAEETGKKIVIAGHGDVEKTIGRKIPDCVEYVGHIGPKERKELMSKCLAGILLTEVEEAFGNAALEYNLSGRPVIVSNKGAFPDTVLDGITGFRGENLHEWISAVDLLDTIEPNICRQWVIDNFSIESQGPKYDEYFESVINFEKGGENIRVINTEPKPPMRYRRKHPMNINAVNTG